MTSLLVPKAPTIIKPTPLATAIRGWTPRSRLGMSVFRALPYLPDELAEELLDRVQSAGIIESRLRMRHFAADGRLIEDYGIVGRKVVTTAGVGFIVDAFQNTTELENMKYHGIGTGATAEAVGDTALVTELTTQYNPDNTRATGSQTEGAANIYETVGTNTVDASASITEHGIFTQAATGGGTLLDRTVFGTISLTASESLESTYDITFTAGS